MSRLLGLALLLLCACAVPPRSPAPPADLRSPFSGYASARYRESRWWLCLPGRDDVCASNLDATELAPDGTRVEVRDRPVPGADQVDCFYVYPTVDVRPWPATHEDFSSLRWETMVAAHQSARFRSVCRVYAPLYRQTSIGTYLQSRGVREPYRAVAESDVVDAFLHYMGQYNRGRKIVLVGHSQGAEMVVALLQRFFDHDAAMRERLLLAMPIGWPMEVPPGETTGGTFDTLPVCTARGQTACVVGFRTYGAEHAAAPGRARPSPGRESVCVNPAELAHGTDRLSRSFFGTPDWFGLTPWVELDGTDGVGTPFVMLRDFYRAACVEGQDGFRYLQVSPAPREGDHRVSPVRLGALWFAGELGTHVLDMQFTGGDLLDLVAERARALAPSAGVEPGR